MTKALTFTSKGNLTGDEVGRIFIRDYARFIKAVQDEQHFPKDKFTDAEKQQMVNSLTEAHDIRQYNVYVGILQYLQKLTMMYNEQYKQLKYLLLATHREVNGAKEIDIVRLLLAQAPLILTEKQYKRLKTQDLAEKTTKKTSVAGILLTAVKYHFLNQSLYAQTFQVEGKTEAERKEIALQLVMKGVQAIKKNNVGTSDQSIEERLKLLEPQYPHYSLFDAYRQQPLTNPEFKKNYWNEGTNGHHETPDGKRSDQMTRKEWVAEVEKWWSIEAETGIEQIKWVDDGREAPPDATKYDVLEYIDGFFKIGEHSTQADLDTFKEDYPDIYKAVLTELKAIKGLGIDDIKPDDYGKPLISYKTLYELDLEYYREFFRFNPKDDGAFIATFISVIPEEETVYWSDHTKASYLDAEGNYKYKLSENEKMILEDMLPDELVRVKEHLRYLRAIQELYKILGEQINEESILALAKDENYFWDEEGETAKRRAELGFRPRSHIELLLEHVNGDIEDMQRGLRSTSPVLSQETIKEVTELINALEPIKPWELKPTQEAINKVRELTKDLGFYGKRGLHLHDILMGLA